MNITNYILDFPKVVEKDSDYYLLQGLFCELKPYEIIGLITIILNRELLKRKILQEVIERNFESWSERELISLFDVLFKFFNESNRYFPRLAAANIIVKIGSRVDEQRKMMMIECFLSSPYYHVRSGTYGFMISNWSTKYVPIVGKAWERWDDEGAVNLIIEKMPDTFVVRNFKKISEYFSDEEIDYDFHKKLTRNKFFARVFQQKRKLVESLKTRDPISYLAILRILKKEVDISWALNLYRNNRNRRFLARWLADFDLWHKILKKNTDPRK